VRFISFSGKSVWGRGGSVCQSGGGVGQMGDLQFTSLQFIDSQAFDRLLLRCAVKLRFQTSCSQTLRLSTYPAVFLSKQFF
jgi:hypothetical protein